MDEEQNKIFINILKSHNSDICPNCGRHLDLYDLAWNASDTEWGTPYTYMNITCQACDTEIVNGQSWYPSDCLDDVLDEALDDLFV